MKTLKNKLTVFLLAGILLSFQSPFPEDFTLAWSTYLGGESSWDQARDVCVDKLGNVIVVGGTASLNFPTTASAYDTSFNGGGTQIGSAGLCDVFVTKYSSTGQLLWSTYVGGPNYDRAYAVGTDSRGNIIIAGRAGPGFPVTKDAVQPFFQGVRAGPYGLQNAFVAKLSADGSQLLWSTFLGVGAMVRDFDLDSQGNIVAAFGSDPGSGNPPADWFKKAYQSKRRGKIESGVVKLKADGKQVFWATWFGGSGDESSEVGISVDMQDRVYITGNTKSTDLTIVGSHSDSTYNGGWDGYLAVFSSDGSHLICSTYLGGSDDDFVLNTHALAVDKKGQAYVHCATSSNNFPTTPGVFSRTLKGNVDIALVKIDILTGKILLGTYIGGSKLDNADGIFVDNVGNVFISGETESVDFPVTDNAFQPVKEFGVDAFILLLKPDFSNMFYSTFFGGINDDRFRSGFLGEDGALYGIGTCSGAGFPVKNASQPDYAGGGGVGDAIVVKFNRDYSIREKK
mgnify:CR=1 FL=1